MFSTKEIHTFQTMIYRIISRPRWQRKLRIQFYITVSVCLLVIYCCHSILKKNGDTYRVHGAVKRSDSAITDRHKANTSLTSSFVLVTFYDDIARRTQHTFVTIHVRRGFVSRKKWKKLQYAIKPQARLQWIKWDCGDANAWGKKINKYCRSSYHNFKDKEFAIHSPVYIIE